MEWSARRLSRGSSPPSGFSSLPSERSSKGFLMSASEAVGSGSASSTNAVGGTQGTARETVSRPAGITDKIIRTIFRIFLIDRYLDMRKAERAAEKAKAKRRKQKNYKM
jgi:hypothetical protein